MTLSQDSPADHARLATSPLDSPELKKDSKAAADSFPWLRRFMSPESKQPTFLGHILLSGALIGGALVINLLMFAFAIRQESNWLNYNQFSKSIEDVEAAAESLDATPAEKARMVEQFMLIQARIRTHAKVMGLFFSLNFVSLGTIGVAAGMTAISLVFISKSGWEKMNNAVINVFITATGLVILHSNLVFIFKFQENIKLNGEFYSEYTAMANSMLSYWAIQPTLVDGMSPAEYILLTDQQLAELGRISLEFDADRIFELKQPFDTFAEQNLSSQQ